MELKPYRVEEGFVEYKEFFKSYVMKYFPAESAEDVVQEFFYIALTKSSGFRTKQDFLNYSFVCIRNICISLLRVKKRLSIINTEMFNPEWFPSLEEADVNFLEEREKAELNDVGIILMLDRAMKKLRPRGRQIMKLTFNGMMPREIADYLHVTVQTVKNQKTTAVNEIKKFVEKRRKQLGAIVNKQRIISEIQIQKKIAALRAAEVERPKKDIKQEEKLTQPITVKDMNRAIG